MDLIIHIDGGSRGNPGPAAAGVVIHDAADHTPICEAGFFLGQTTNNVAEYRGLVRALDIAAKLNPRQIHIHSDSQLMVRQIHGEYRVKSEELKPWFNQARQKLDRFTHWSIQHVPREENQRADELVNLALDAGRDVIIESPAGFSPPANPPQTSHSDSPKPVWHLRVCENADERCPAQMRAGQSYRFGPVTAAGFCVYAAQAFFRGWTPNSKQLTCPRCGIRIDVESKPAR